MGFFVFAAALLALPARAATASAAPGHAVTFSVAASGTAPFTYRWYKDGALIKNAVLATYVISSVQAADAGSYYAVVANAAGAVTSDRAVLSILSGSSSSGSGGNSSPAAGTAQAAALPAGSTSGTAAVLGSAAGAAAPAVAAAAGAGGPTAAVAGGSAGGAGAYRLGQLDASGDWRVISIDTRADGTTDVVWQNVVSGAAELWVMDGAIVAEVIALADVPRSGSLP